MRRHHFSIGWAHFWRQLLKVLRNPIFLVLTVIGNAMVAIGSALFYWAERGANASVQSYGDAVWWAFVTITTVGYGDIYPTTIAGRLVAVLLMLTGGVLFLSFIALLSSAFVELEFLELQHSIKQLLSRVERLVEKAESNSNQAPPPPTSTGS